MKSIKAYLVIVILSVICLTNFTAALHGYRESLRSADGLVDQQIMEKLNIISTLVSNGSRIPEDMFNHNTLFQVWENDELVIKSAQAPDHRFVKANNQFHIVSHQSYRWRAIGSAVNKTNISVIVAAKYDIYSALTEDILLKAIVPIVWVLPVVGLLVVVVISIGLAPVKRLANDLARREANDFSALSQEGYTQELYPIVAALNSLFLRLSSAFERERRFSADAAHELRTPLAALKVNLHNLAQELGSEHDLSVLNRTTDRMEHCIEQLLDMHRASLDFDENKFTPCDLNLIAKSVIAELYDAIAAKHQIIELAGLEATILGEAFSLSVMIRNLIDNASKYTPENGSIRISTGKVERRIYLAVEDSGPGIAEEEYARVLDRFYRVGGDRHQSNIIGSGLGLSIVSYIVEQFHGVMSLSKSDSLGGLKIEIWFSIQSEEESYL